MRTLKKTCSPLEGLNWWTYRFYLRALVRDVHVQKPNTVHISSMLKDIESSGHTFDARRASEPFFLHAVEGSPMDLHLPSASLFAASNGFCQVSSRLSKSGFLLDS